MKVFVLFCLIAVSLAQFSFYPPNIIAFTATLGVTVTPTGQAPLTATGTEKYLVANNVVNDFLTETANVQGQQLSFQEWVVLDANNFNEWDIESNAPTTCNHATVPVAQLPVCSAWTITGATATMNCKITDQGQTEVDNFVLAMNGNLPVRLNVTITVNNQLVQTSSVTFAVTGTPTAADFTRPATCAPAKKALHFRRF